MKFLYLFFILQISIFLSAETKLVIEEIVVKNLKESGKKWDVFGKAPDVQIEIFYKKSNMWKSIFKSQVYKNVFIVKNVDLKLDSEVKDLKIKIVDKDAITPDFIGSYEFSFDGNLDKQTTEFDSVKKFFYYFKSTGKKKYGKLDSRVQYKLNQVIDSLKRANETLIRNWPNAKKEAQRFLDSAKRNLDYINKDYHGKFDEKHPDFVAVVNNIKKMQTRLDAFGKEAQNEVKPKPQPQTDKKNYGKLDSRVVYKLKGVTQTLNGAEQTLDRNWSGAKKSAQQSVDSAKQKLDYIEKNYSGKFDERHPDFVSVVNRLNKIQARLENFDKPTPKVIHTEPQIKKTNQKLNSKVQYKLEQVIVSLKNINDILVRNWSGAKQHAQRSLDSTKQNLEHIKKDYSGKFDENHPDFVAVVNNIKKMQARLDVFGKKPQDSTNETLQPQSDKKNYGKLNSKVRYKLDAVKKNLDSAEETLARNWANARENAQRSIDSAKTNFEQIGRDYKGEFDKQHPDFVAVINRLNKIQGLLNALREKEDALHKVQPTLAKIIEENQQRIYKSLRTTNVEIDVREPDIDKIRDVVIKLNADLPPALSIVADIYKNYPDQKAFKETDLGWKIISGCEDIEKMNKDWQALINSRTNDYNEQVKEYLASADSLKQEAEKNKNPMTARVWAGQIKQYAQWGNTCIDAIKILVSGVEPQTKKDVLLETSKLEEQIFALEKYAAKLVNKVISDEKLKLERARFPKTKYTGSKWENVTQTITLICKEEFASSVIKKISVNSPWNEKRQGKWRGNIWEWNTYKYIGAWVCKKTESGKFLVYNMMFRRTKQSDGSWSELRYYSVGTVYEILEENINK
ncbi:hypothetical protein [Candidatus Uabimicrobium sp. HlEnr_7]|uniref:hypothetical protein n=1 Tax=Candidatus Uabimicrobium helgolandensis TaxID=3095367 RepID=UPI0035580F39